MKTFPQLHLWKLPDLAILKKMILGQLKKERMLILHVPPAENPLPKGLTSSRWLNCCIFLVSIDKQNWAMTTNKPMLIGIG